MRLNGTKYESIDQLPKNAIVVSKFADSNSMAVGYVYVKYERFIKGETNKHPGYTIRCFQGSNFVIPQ